MTALTPLPPAPNRTDPATFSDKADTFVASLGNLVTEINAIQGIDPTIVAVSALDINIAAGGYFTKTITENATFTFSNVPTDRLVAFTLRVTCVGNVTITFPASVKFTDDVSPVLSASKTHLFLFVTENGGTTFRASALVNYEA